MILRKPYALLIRNFKRIHAILLFLMILFFRQISKLHTFFATYIKQALYQQITGVVRDKVTASIFLWYILIVAFLTVIIVLLRTKEKPIRAYLFTNIFYIINLFVIVITIVALNSIQLNSISVQLIRITTDVLMLSKYLQIPFMILIASRIVGFNIKQFNFQKDLHEIAIEEGDDAEFELGLELDAEDFKTKVNRKLRIANYLIRENKVLLSIALVFVVLSLSISSYVYFGVIKKIYHEHETFKTSSMAIKVIDTHQFKARSNNTIVSKKDFFVAVTLSVKNNAKYEQKLPLEEIFLRTDEKTRFEAYTKHRDDFAELGIRYRSSQKIAPGARAEYVIIYRVPEKFREVNKQLEYLDSIIKKGNEHNYKYIKIQLKSKEYNKAKIDSEKNLNEELKFNGSLLKNSSIKIKSFDLAERYYHEYISIDPYTKKENKLLTIVRPEHTDLDKKIVAKLELEIKTDISIDDRASDRFFERYGQLKYQINSKEYIHEEVLYEIEPSDKKSLVYFELSSKVLEAEKIYVDFVIRDKAYRYNLFEKQPEIEKE